MGSTGEFPDRQGEAKWMPEALLSDCVRAEKLFFTSDIHQLTASRFLPFLTIMKMCNKYSLTLAFVSLACVRKSRTSRTYGNITFYL